MLKLQIKFKVLYKELDLSINDYSSSFRNDLFCLKHMRPMKLHI